ncbi:MAG: tyrosine-type recombinase/integrase [Gammaproteobacteria bacterium]|nr:tyrosine-type recombinase/integrase [Gammaproteobacteria bacterium]
MKINTVNRRKQLKARKTPYFHPIGKGKAIGFYRTPEGGTWHARQRAPDGKQVFKPLGGDLDSDYGDMLKTAQVWFEQVPVADGARNQTLQNCIDDYVEHLKVEKNPKTATDTCQRLEKHLTDRLLKTDVSALTTQQIKRFRDSMVSKGDNPEVARRSKDSANRVMNMLKAALNLAFRSGVVHDDTAWRRVESFKGVGNARVLFLSDKQVKTLLETTKGGIHKLIKAGALNGARYGELSRLRVEDFSPSEATLLLTGKTGTHTAYLSRASVSFFKELAKDKTPKAFLLTKDDGTQWKTSHQQRPFREAVEKAKLPSETVFYSLRHYHISKALLAGIPIQVVAENCGTSIKMIEKHYGKFLATDRRKLLDKVALL